jgi:hypothetical protein
MDGPSVDKLRNELEQLMKEHIELTQRRTFLGITPEEVLQEKSGWNASAKSLPSS